DEAIKSITAYPAEILGVAGHVGTLEKGRDATFIITNGDPLETATQVEAAYIQGREVDLNDRHKRLWKKYEEKYRRLGLMNE
ncbi:MAG TPA: amidohydrolase family protein, partial [Pirellulaceae bacterium]|nr:amidohydrolase family protein [Pirellulaceae bacterium]